MASKILIIDSDISLSTVLRDYLESRGYEAKTAGDGKAGLNELANGTWDVLLMELQGLGMNGYELLKNIRHRLPQIPLIILTTRSDRADQMRAFELGADDYQTKPFSMDILICRIEAILRRVRAFTESKQRVFDVQSSGKPWLRSISIGVKSRIRPVFLSLTICVDRLKETSPVSMVRTGFSYSSII